MSKTNPLACGMCGQAMQPMGRKVTDRRHPQWESFLDFYWCPNCGTIKPCDGEAVAPEKTRQAFDADKRTRPVSSNKDFDAWLLSAFRHGEPHGILPGRNVKWVRMPFDMAFTAQQAVAIAHRLLECAGLKPSLECPGHGRGGMSEPCCPRAGEYNGYNSDGPLKFTCPKGCSCHD